MIPLARRIIISIVVFLLPLGLLADSAKLRFAVVPKGVGNEFFLEVKDGCEQAAADLGDVECLYGGSEESSARAQNTYIEQLIKKGIDGIAVSVIHSEFLASRGMRKAWEANIPVVTFNSDFTEEVKQANPGLRAAYVGTDNFQFGWELGEIVRQLRPVGGRLCLISGYKYGPALQQRVNGVRAALSGIKDSSLTVERLDGENGWAEYSRCPFYSNELPDRALTQLLHAVKKNEVDPELVDTIVSVGAWPQQNEEVYRKSLESYREVLDKRKIVIVMGDAMLLQQRLLSERLAHANVGQNPYQMGYVAIELLRQIVKGGRVPETVHTPLIKCFPGKEQICSE